METDKALVEVPSPRAGVIAALHGNEGEILKVGNALVTFQSEPVGASPRSVAQRASESDTRAAGAKASPGPSSNGSRASTPAPAAEEDAGTVVGKVGGSLAGI